VKKFIVFFTIFLFLFSFYSAFAAEKKKTAKKKTEVAQKAAPVKKEEKKEVAQEPKAQDKCAGMALKMKGLEPVIASDATGFVGEATGTVVWFQYSTDPTFATDIAETETVETDPFGERIIISSHQLQPNLTYYARLAGEKNGERCFSSPVSFLRPEVIYVAGQKETGPASKTAVALHCFGSGVMGYGIATGGKGKALLVVGGFLVNMAGYTIDGKLDSADYAAMGLCGGAMGMMSGKKGGGVSPPVSTPSSGTTTTTTGHPSGPGL
jgi:hypothetical protein